MFILFDYWEIVYLLTLSLIIVLNWIDVGLLLNFDVLFILFFKINNNIIKSK
jgi:hypothetical protein